VCGLAGLIHPNRDAAHAAATATTAAVRHRGPDADGLDVFPFGRQFVALGHRRLSILDLSPLGRQPMTDPATGNALVFNGEIYNFRSLQRELRATGVEFRSTGDTEVLLAALTRWGVPATLKRLEGMYAFAFLDRRDCRLTLARDPLGIKPLYLAETGGGVAFASEVRAVLASGLVPDEIDRRGLAGFLAYGAVQHPFTLHERVRSLPPGSYQQFTATDTGWTADRPVSFWSYPEPESVDARTATDTVRDTVTAAVRDHLIADVPVGVFLSAGLDSTIVAGVAAEAAPDLRAFTVGFSDHPDVSEMTLAADTAKLLGLTHVPINLPVADAETAFGEWLTAADQPSIDGLNTFVISRAVRREGIKVALSGLGADELFGGYPSFRDVPRLMRMRRRVGWLPGGVRRGLAGAVALRRPAAVRRKLADMMGGNGSLTDLYFHRRRVLSDREMSALGFRAGDIGLTPDFHDRSELAGIDPADPVRAVSQLESRFYQGNMLLRDSDVMGMAHGLEIRVPFLDRRLLEVVHAIPGAVRLPPGVPGKHLLRTAFAHLLRPQLTERPKTGFTLPVARWMLGPLRERCQKAIAACGDALSLPKSAVQGVWAEFERQPAGPQWTRALALVAAGDFVSR
jgi:asparagine synthase (glutamine-hydrolysing)